MKISADRCSVIAVVKIRAFKEDSVKLAPSLAPSRRLRRRLDIQLDDLHEAIIELLGLLFQEPGGCLSTANPERERGGDGHGTQCQAERHIDDIVG